VSATTRRVSLRWFGPDGRTLYLLTKDDAGKSTCYDACAKVWPPLTVDGRHSPTAADGAPGRLGMTTRNDGSRQVTYDGWPLYYYAQDAAAVMSKARVSMYICLLPVPRL